MNTYTATEVTGDYFILNCLNFSIACHIIVVSSSAPELVVPDNFTEYYEGQPHSRKVVATCWLRRLGIAAKCTCHMATGLSQSLVMAAQREDKILLQYSPLGQTVIP